MVNPIHSPGMLKPVFDLQYFGRKAYRPRVGCGSAWILLEDGHEREPLLYAFTQSGMTFTFGESHM